jgi:hypothetical protein
MTSGFCHGVNEIFAVLELYTLLIGLPNYRSVPCKIPEEWRYSVDPSVLACVHCTEVIVRWFKLKMLPLEFKPNIIFGYHVGNIRPFNLCIHCLRGTLLVAQLVEALRYKPEDNGFDSWLCHWNFSLTYSFRPHYGAGVDSAFNKNEYQEYFLGGGKGGRCIVLTTLPFSYPNCPAFWEPQPPGTLRACPGL